jgi:hypothetical protein
VSEDLVKSKGDLWEIFKVIHLQSIALLASIGHLELLDIPARWGRIDAFGRGRITLRSVRRGGAKAGRSRQADS